MLLIRRSSQASSSPLPAFSVRLAQHDVVDDPQVGSQRQSQGPRRRMRLLLLRSGQGGMRGLVTTTQQEGDLCLVEALVLSRC